MTAPNHGHDWDDDRIGVPTAGRARPPLPVEYAPPARPEDIVLREGETELGRPPQVPTTLAALTDADRLSLHRLDEEQAARDLAEAEAMIVSDPTGLGWLGWFGSPLAIAAGVGATGLAGIFIFNQTLSLVASLSQQPLWAQYVGFAGLGALGFCVLYAFLRLVFLYATLRRNRQIRMAGLAELSRRTRLRWLAVAKSAEAKLQLETYLRLYPLDTEKDRKTLVRLGLSDEAQAKMRAARLDLLDPEKFASTDQWFTRFRDGFQAEVDAAAETRVKYWGSRVWVVTAVAPNNLVDTGATLFYTFSMVADLCQLYNLRAGRTGTAVLMGRVFFNAYLAGQGTEWEKLAEDQYDQLFHEAMNVVGVGVGSNVVGKLLGKVGAKATTGYLNRILMIRLGKYSARLLRPVSRD